MKAQIKWNLRCFQVDMCVFSINGVRCMIFIEMENLFDFLQTFTSRVRLYNGFDGFIWFHSQTGHFIRFDISDWRCGWRSRFFDIQALVSSETQHVGE